MYVSCHKGLGFILPGHASKVGPRKDAVKEGATRKDVGAECLSEPSTETVRSSH